MRRTSKIVKTGSHTHNPDLLVRGLLEDLWKVGYKTNYGEDGSGFVFLALKRGGGYYLGLFLQLLDKFRCVLTWQR